MGKFKTSPLMNPLAQFVTPAAQESNQPQSKNPKPKTLKVKYRAKDDRETPRNRRAQFLFRPALFDALRKLANSRGMSINNCVEDIISQYLEQMGEK